MLGVILRMVVVLAFHPSPLLLLLLSPPVRCRYRAVDLQSLVLVAVGLEL